MSAGSVNADIGPGISGRVSVIIPVATDAEGLRETLSSLHRQTMPSADFEVIVGNDGGYAEISAICREFGVIEVVIKPNRGAYAARNAALRKSTGSILAFTDADMSLAPDWCEAGRRALAESDYCGGPINFVSNGRAGVAEMYQACYAFQTKREFKDVGYFPTANLWVKREVFRGVGLFDERLRSGGDYEFGTRVGRTGRYTQKFADDVVSQHPFRTGGEMVRKIRRTTRGIAFLKDLYPEHYTHLVTGRSFYRRLIPPRQLPPSEVPGFQLSLGQRTAVYCFQYFLKLYAAYILLIGNLGRRKETSVGVPTE